MGRHGLKQEAETLKAASSILEVPLTVIKKAKEDGCDAFRHGRVDLDVLKKWLAGKKQIYKDAKSKDALEIRRLEGQCRKIEIENDAKMGTLLVKEEVEREAVRIFSSIRTEIEGLENLAPQLAGISVPELAKRLREAAREMLQQLADCKWDKQQTPLINLQG